MKLHLTFGGLESESHSQVPRGRPRKLDSNFHCYTDEGFQWLEMKDLKTVFLSFELSDGIRFGVV